MAQSAERNAVVPGTGKAPALPPADQDWTVPQPEHVPRPTWVPGLLAAGIIFSLWGIATTWAISGVGFLLCALALTWWIRELLHGA